METFWTESGFDDGSTLQARVKSLFESNAFLLALDLKPLEHRDVRDRLVAFGQAYTDIAESGSANAAKMSVPITLAIDELCLHSFPPRYIKKEGMSRAKAYFLSMGTQGLSNWNAAADTAISVFSTRDSSVLKQFGTGGTSLPPSMLAVPFIPTTRIHFLFAALACICWHGANSVGTGLEPYKAKLKGINANFLVSQASFTELNFTRARKFVVNCFT
jgi:hypothetical protein